MKNLAGKRITQIVLICLTAICMFAGLASLLAVTLAGDSGMYEADSQEDYDEILTREQNDLATFYAVAMLQTGDRETKDYSMMEDSNMDYVIVQAKTDDAAEEVLYASKNAKKDIGAFRHTAECTEISSIQPNISYYMNKNIISVLLKSRYLTLHSYAPEDYVTTNYVSIDDVYYEEDTGRFYYVNYAGDNEDKDLLFLIQNISLSEEEGIEEYQWNANHTYVASDSDDVFLDSSNFTNRWGDVWFDNFWYEPTEIKTMDKSELQNCNIISDYQFYPYGSGGHYQKELRMGLSEADVQITYDKTELPEKEVQKYLVYTNVNETLEQNGLDYFYEQQQIYQNLFQHRYHCIGVLIFAVLLAITAIILYIYGILHRKPKSVPFLRKIPLLLLLAVFALFAGADGFVLVACCEMITEVSNGLLSLSLAAIIFCLAAAVFLTMLLIGECAARIRDKVFLKTTLCYPILCFCRKYFKKGLEIIPLAPKVLIAFLLLSILEFLVIALTSYETWIEAGLFLTFKAVETPVLLLTIWHIYRLQEAAKQMAGGNLQHHVNTDYMFLECKRHGNYLNQIADGMNRAVEERLKSERFRTELITNVSHDIKTPLTSIVNYVDLLQKEGISNEEREEYIQVLDRQSARLKKLIDDLMDASKASTGNLEVNPETCNVGIMMVQTLGEYEEKMVALDLSLIADSPSDTLLVTADSRHLWRIFDNLLGNICKYSQPGTRVYVNQEADAGQVKIIFRNTSKYPLNLSSEELMERFTRGDSSRHTEGSGLGLSIAKNLTELMQGKFILTIDGDLFKVTIILPRLSKNDTDSDA